MIIIKCCTIQEKIRKRWHFCCLFLLLACGHADVKEDKTARGKTLAGKFCQSCHLLPSPDLLDARTWAQHVLPQMGPRLGIFEYMNQRYPNNSEDPNVGRSFYPAEPLLSVEEWGELIDYYTSTAPDSLGAQKRGRPLRADTSVFRVVNAVHVAGGRTGQGSQTPPATCLIRYDSSLQQLLTADINRHSLERWDAHLEGLPALSTGGAIVDLVRRPEGFLACNIGAMAPNNALAGHIDLFKAVGHGLVSDTGSVYDGLMRPVNIAGADLNGDGKEDLVVCEFGYIKGALSWLENKGTKGWERHVLRSVPGAIRVVVQDYNHDGLPDIWALFAQGDEGIFLYTNKGNGQFTEQSVLRFPPSYGSTYFELADLDHDGNLDILYTCGDNGDFSTILKPYHGVYIFINDGPAHFTRRYFYPINGCYRAMAGDFNGDGQPDIAAIAYFADYQHQPEEGFVYFQQVKGSVKGALQFTPYSVPGTEVGRWITMEVADINGDGRPEVLLANCSVGPVLNKGMIDWKKGPPFLVLGNRVSGEWGVVNKRGK